MYLCHINTHDNSFFHPALLVRRYLFKSPEFSMNSSIAYVTIEIIYRENVLKFLILLILLDFIREPFGSIP